MFTWIQLFFLTFFHLAVDVFGGVLGVILPEVRERFGMTLPMGLALIALFQISCNFIQIPVGRLRADKKSVFFLPIGVVLAALIALLGLIPADRSFVPLLFVLVVLVGIGIALTHPEGLRAVHLLPKIPASVTTSIYMIGGYLGFSSGGLAGAYLVDRFGFKGLLLFFAVPVVCVPLLYVLKIRLAVERKGDTETAKYVDRIPSVPFRELMLISIPAATAATIIPSILPTRLNEMGFSLMFRGTSTLLFGVGSAAGSILWGVMAHFKGILPTTLFALASGVPFLVTYFFVYDQPWALWLLLGAGFFSGAVFPLIVTLARYAEGMPLGQRMGWIVGGTWGGASIILMGLGPVAEQWGTHLVLNFSYVCYVLAALAALWVWLKNLKKTRTDRG